MSKSMKRSGMNYLVAMIREGKHFEIKPLDTGRKYTREGAMKRAAELQETCQYELKYLDYDRFVPYTYFTE